MLTKGMIMIIVGVFGVLVTSIIILLSLIKSVKEKSLVLKNKNIDYSSLRLERQTEVGANTRK